MFRDYAVYFKGNIVGIFRDSSESGALQQAKMKVGNASKYSSANNQDFVVIKYGIL